MSMSVPTPALPAVASIAQPQPTPVFGAQTTAGTKPGFKGGQGAGGQTTQLGAMLTANAGQTSRQTLLGGGMAA